MRFEARLSPHAGLIALEEDYRRSAGCQIVADAALGRGIGRGYLFLADGAEAGYGVVRTAYYPGHISVFHVLPWAARWADELYDAFVAASGATAIQVQTNIASLRDLGFDRANRFRIEKLLFADGGERRLSPPEPDGFVFLEAPNPSPNHPESRDYRLTVNGEECATGGYLCHYNPPFADVHMAVAEKFRGQGWGAFYVQEVMKAARLNGRIPAARCSPDNAASRRTLEKAGFVSCGRLVLGRLKRNQP